MTKTSETRKINSKLRQCDESLAEFKEKNKKNWSKIYKEFRLHVKNMIKFLFFFPLDNGKIDWLHVFEVIAIDIVILFAFSKQFMNILEMWAR